MFIWKNISTLSKATAVSLAIASPVWAQQTPESDQPINLAIHEWTG